MKIAYAGFDLLYPMLTSLFSNGCEIVKIFTNKVDNVFEHNEKVIAFANEHSIPVTTDKITLEDLEELKAQGITHFISVRDNVLETLKGYLKELGI